ncbi:MAG: flagellar basal body P-ring formation chaperone FlgA [Allgaiera sp.]|jgi:flagella basal body P-ring formation protein FlgA|nr:flagellar basal body P-ring formation chaperone FlgA [Allgaiera sp.]
MRAVLLSLLLSVGLAQAATGTQAPTLPPLTPVSRLIAEKATAATGAAMPPSASYEVELAPGSIESGTLVSAFRMDPASGAFAANVETQAGETWRVTGLATLMMPVPVPVRRILPDAILTKQDFAVVKLPYQQLNSFTVTSLRRLDGMQVRRVLTAGRPVMEQSVSPPIVVSQGDRVSIEYHKGRMQLTAPGRAITSAEADHEVRVINLVSNRTVTGIARAAGVVEVQP